VRDARISWRWIEPCLVRHAGSGGVGHGIVDLEDKALRAVFAIGLPITLLYDRECVENEI
jgi:hypothetical protein